MLEGKTVNLKIMEREDLTLVNEWVNDPDYMGEYEAITQETIAETQRQYDQLKDGQWFFIEKKDGTKIGHIAHFLSGGHKAIGYALHPEERGKGYGSEAIQIMVDYLFLGKDISRIQAETDPQNLRSQRALQKAGFSKEGIMRRSYFCRGVWRDTALFSIVREDWSKPKILTNAAPSYPMQPRLMTERERRKQGDRG